MAYTVVSFDIVPPHLPCVALYRYSDDRTEYVAEIVVAFALYRDPESRGSENVPAPLHVDDFVRVQSASYANRRLLSERLPRFMVIDPGLHAEVALYSAEHGCAAPVKRSAASGFWEVQL